MSKKATLQQLITKHVRNELPRRLPLAFSDRSSNVLLSHDEKKVGATMETLAALNGYERLDLPSRDDVVFLAEGITVEPDFYKNGAPTQSIFIFAQPIDENAYPYVCSQKEFPELIEEDHRLYRILENNAEYFITTIYDSVRQNFQKRIVGPLDALIIRFLQKEPEPAEKTKNLLAQQLNEETNVSQLHNLIVLRSNGDAVLIRHIPPSASLLALPHRMGHKSASTLISVSLVVFGAVPLAYRSFRFAMDLQDYPLLSKAVGMSVLGTVLYGIWSGRNISRTRQSEVVSLGMGSRIYARDDAVLAVLQEGAVRRVSTLLSQTYYNELNRAKGGGRTITDESKITIPLLDGSELLSRIGLMRPMVGKTDGQKVAVDIDAAIAILKSTFK